VHYVAAADDRMPLDLWKQDPVGHDATDSDITEAAYHPTGKVSPNVGWFRWQNLARHPTLMVGPEADGLRFLLCPPRSTMTGLHEPGQLDHRVKPVGSGTAAGDQCGRRLSTPIKRRERDAPDQSWIRRARPLRCLPPRRPSKVDCRRRPGRSDPLSRITHLPSGWHQGSATLLGR